MPAGGRGGGGGADLGCWSAAVPGLLECCCTWAAGVLLYLSAAVPGLLECCCTWAAGVLLYLGCWSAGLGTSRLAAGW